MILKATIVCTGPTMARCPIDGTLATFPKVVITKETTTMHLHFDCSCCGNILETPTLIGESMEDIIKHTV